MSSDDFFGLKKMDESLKNLGKDLERKLKIDTKQPQKTQANRPKSSNKSDLEQIKAGAVEAAKIIKFIAKVSKTRKKPQDLDQIIAQAKSLQEQESKKDEAEKALKIIQEYQRLDKVKSDMARKQTIQKILRKAHLERFNYVGIKNPCCNNSTMVFYAGNYYQCRVCKKLYLEKT